MQIWRITLSLCAILCLPATGRAQDIREALEGPRPRLTRPPRLLRFVEAPFPKQAQERGIAGTVELRLTLDARGKVSRAELLSGPDPALARAALRAARQFVFSPAEVDGKPAAVTIRYAYNFVLQRVFRPRLPDWMLPERARPLGRAPLAGRVREKGTRMPLAAVAVALPRRGIELTTDEQGRFSVPGLAAGRYEVRVISPGHKQDTVTVEVRAGEQARVDFFLDPLTVDPYQTVVRGKRLQTSVTRISLRQRELSTVPGTFGDPIRVVENLPGMARVPFGAGALLIRGASPEDSGVFLNGVKIPIIYHFLGGPSVLNPQFLDRIDYHAGNADSRYGRLVAGVVSVGARSTFTERLHGSVDVSLLNAGLFLNIPLTKKVSLAIAGRRSYIDAILPAIVEATGETMLSVLPVYYDYQLRLDARLSERDSLALLAFGSDDRMALASEAPTLGLDVAGRIMFHRLHGEWRARRGAVTSRFAPHVGIQFANMDYQSYGKDTEVSAVVGGAREDLQIKVGPRILLRTGVDLELEQRTYDSLVAPYGIQPASVDELRGGVGLYLDAVIGVGPRLQLIPGARFDLVFFLDTVLPSISPRLAARYRLSEQTTLKGAAGLFSQAPATLAIDRSPEQRALFLEHALHLSAGVERQLLPALKLDVSGFFIYRWNLVPLSRITETAYDQVFGYGFDNDGDGFSFGMELLLRHDVTERLYGWVSYTLSRSVSRRYPGQDYDRNVFDQTHILTIVGSVRLGWGIEAGLRFRLVSGNPLTPVIGGYYDSDLNMHQPINGPRHSQELPLFHQLDLRIEKTWRFDWWRLSLYLDVLNVYNAENPEMTFHDYRFRESGQLRGIPILPTLGIKGSF